MATRSQVQRLLKAGLVLVDGKPVKASHRLRRRRGASGDAARARAFAHSSPRPSPSTWSTRTGSCWWSTSRPGWWSIRAAGVRRGTLVNALLAHCTDLSGIGGVVRPGIVHRLDKGTSGLMVVAKDDRTHLEPERGPGRAAGQAHLRGGGLGQPGRARGQRSRP